jgi:hypothetical protein
MSAAEELTRKKNERKSHRASVTKMIHRVTENLESPSENLLKLRQQQQTLTEKAVILSTLDGDIVKLVPEEELDGEIETADDYREKITLAIVEIDEALPLPQSPPPQSPQVLPVSSSPYQSTPHPVSHGPSPRVKLPKLTIKKFDGDLTKWVSFWDAFESSIHNNSDLTDIDKFNYLQSFLESTAYEVVSGLTLTSSNYSEAVDTLKKRFGNPQLIINKHMDALLALPAVTSHSDLKGLRHLYDSVESHIRGLRSLGVLPDSYGSLLTSILMNKLPGELRLVIARELTEDYWDVQGLMEIINKELDARERSTTHNNVPKRPPQHRSFPTGAVLVTTNTSSNGCVYCGGLYHQSTHCTGVPDSQARKEILRKTGRCFVCLRRNHTSRNCRSRVRCTNCNGRHHTTICLRSNDQASSVTSVPSSHEETNAMYINSDTPILLQTAKLNLINPEEASHPPITVRAVLDRGSQRTYITQRTRERLRLLTKSTEFLRIKTFGTSEGQETQCETVKLGVHVSSGEIILLNALVVTVICNPITFQPISVSRDWFHHLMGLELAGSANTENVLEIDVLIGSDSYWNFITGRLIRGRRGPVAIQTKMGWVLSGPVDPAEVSTNLTFNSTHTLTIAASQVDSNLDNQLKQFWDLESLGIMKNEPPVYEKFIQQIQFIDGRYQVSLPWKETHPVLPTNYGLCHKRLDGILRRLRDNPPLLIEYNHIILDQIEKGIVEVVSEDTSVEGRLVHYLPHHGIVRRDKLTSKLRIVYDASAKTKGHPSLNDCLYTGPSFDQFIFDILLRFRIHKIVLTGDIEKAFLMVAVEERDRDVLRFLWVRDIGQKENYDIWTLRFTRVVFGVSCSSFLLNGTIYHHMESFRNEDPLFVDKFLLSIYVDNVTLMM